ncbi:BaiN/RdsA family NAD(P)/FAD-dependent oxidoreductase [Dongia sedimenti]|uniref:TIGR03862 family flavoprotein n=1 Tax=Dongia sedimenti TaxID=3064282 RepID=A0ABU0YKK1_9PROT|nr:TIGR03862 family flavoprotein [Rhodospirillaceae bacterium R-7]
MAEASEISTDVAIIGAGPAGLMAAERLSGRGLKVTVFDAMATPGRKFLMAGRGGLNLTHSEPLPQFVARYGERAAQIAPWLERFSPEDLRRWADGLGAETFIGSSGRVFPKAMKASGLLRNWLKRLAESGVDFKLRQRWSGFDGNRLLFDGGPSVSARATVLALGGASWPKLGSDAAWVPILAARGVQIAPLQPANCGFDVAWSAHFRDRAAGQPLKNIALMIDGRRVLGEMVITRNGIEGGAVYAISAALRDRLPAVLSLDLKPQIHADALAGKLAARRKGRSLSAWLSGELNLTPLAYSLLREVADPLPDNLAALARLIKNVPLKIERARPIAEAISSAGGIAFDAVDETLMVRTLPGVFVAGEMLDWEAPTGGYLLQACMSSAVVAADGVVACVGR